MATSLLLIVVFLGFGLVAAGLGVADAPATPRYLDGSTTAYSHWLFSRLL
ncbi:MAG: hypothetical protein ACNA7W_05150 [Pseudomonadales bacterium]